MLQIKHFVSFNHSLMKLPFNLKNQTKKNRLNQEAVLLEYKYSGIIFLINL